MSPAQVIKPVVVRTDGQYVMCVLPASEMVDLMRCATGCTPTT